MDEPRTTRDADAPKRWNVSTSPLKVVWHYAQDHVTEEQIIALLDQNGIQSLVTLKDEAFTLVSVLKERSAGELIDAINAALLRTPTRPTEVLGGKRAFDTSCIDATSLSCYSSKAVAFKQSRPFEARRIPNFTLVLGPSGSGKTMFCMQYLPRKVFPQAKSMKDIFRVHVKASSLLGDYYDDESTPKTNLPALLVKHVQGVVRSWLPEYAASTVPPIDLFLLVVIDEAGCPGYKCFFETACEIEKIVAALQQMPTYTFAKGVHVTVTGTSLETLTQSIDSMVETIKIRMKPWSPKHFHAMLANMKRDDEHLVKRMVKCFPILENLTTNARCAFFLVDTLPQLTCVRKERWADHVAASVANVTRRYVASNGLGDLELLENGKFIVAQEIFKTLNEAMDHPFVPRFPTFDHIKIAMLRSVGHPKPFGYQRGRKSRRLCIYQRRKQVRADSIDVQLRWTLACSK